MMRERDPANDADRKVPGAPDRPGEEPPGEADLVDEESMDSFPASDPPSWGPLRAGDPDEEPLPDERPDRKHDE